MIGIWQFVRRLFGRSGAQPKPRRRRSRRPRRRIRLVPLRRRRSTGRAGSIPARTTDWAPYRLARFDVRTGGFLDLSGDGDPERLGRFDLPALETPEELAGWLERPLGQLAWLTYRFCENDRPENQATAHYVFRWQKKRSGRGWRLIEMPKPILKAVQRDILREILDKVPAHGNAHGFVSGRSVLTAARPHIGQRVLLKFDLENFYTSVRFSRVVAVFRSLGYSREAALWLARLTTSVVPPTISGVEQEPDLLRPYLSRHLPQGAPTSPALANLSAFSLDVRLSGLARSFGVRYTRYADDLTFSGSKDLLRALPTFIPLVGQIIREERFRVHRQKRKVLRNNQRQTVTGVVVNERANVPRREYDRLKAILTNCLRHGAASQNRAGHADFAAHLRGKIEYVAQLNSKRGERLRALYHQIDFSR